jgi:hypothetical protein
MLSVDCGHSQHTDHAHFKKQLGAINGATIRGRTFGRLEFLSVSNVMRCRSEGFTAVKREFEEATDPV